MYSESVKVTMLDDSDSLDFRSAKPVEFDEWKNKRKESAAQQDFMQW